MAQLLPRVHLNFPFQNGGSYVKILVITILKLSIETLNIVNLFSGDVQENVMKLTYPGVPSFKLILM